MAYRNFNIATIKRLFAESKSHCARCKCNICPDGSLIGEISHIEAVSKGGPRYNKKLNATEVNGYDNLLILCSNCHTIIDAKENELKYSPYLLREIKEDHKTNFNGIEFTPDEKILELAESRFQELLQKELLEIKILLEQLNSENCIVEITKEFATPSKFYPSYESINKFYFSSVENEILETIRQKIEHNSSNHFIISGPPSSGKTMFSLKLSSIIDATYQKRYLNFSQFVDIVEVRRDLKILKNFPTLLVIDNAHSVYSTAIAIFNECLLYENISLVFLCRDIDERLKVDSLTGINLFENVDNLFQLDPLANQSEKIKTLVDLKKQSIEKHKNITAEIGDLEKIERTINKNLLKLNILLDIWDDYPSERLDSISDERINKILFQKYFPKYGGKDLQELRIYTAINQFEINFYFKNKNLEEIAKRDGLVLSSKDGYYFYHPSFARLLLEAIIQEDINFNIDYQEGYRSFEKKHS